MTADAIRLYFSSMRSELAHVERILDGGDETVRRNLIASIHNMGMRDRFNNVIDICTAIAAAEAGNVVPAPKELRSKDN
jgi:hypothetical protein